MGKEKGLFFTPVYVYLFLHFLTDDLIGTGQIWVLGGSGRQKGSREGDRSDFYPAGGGLWFFCEAEG